MRFFASDFFHESPSPKPLIITLESFRIFSKIHGDIRKSRCTGANLPPVTTPVANFATSSPCVVDTGRRCQRRPWQIATGVKDTCGKFATGVIDTGAK
jgi:hypothetical protein